LRAGESAVEVEQLRGESDSAGEKGCAVDGDPLVKEVPCGVRALGVGGEDAEFARADVVAAWAESGRGSQDERACRDLCRCELECKAYEVARQLGRVVVRLGRESKDGRESWGLGWGLDEGAANQGEQAGVIADEEIEAAGPCRFAGGRCRCDLVGECVPSGLLCWGE